jgi:intracellular multiplication protein IcmJ
MPFHVDIVSKKWTNNAGFIIFLPEMTQVELNSLLQSMFYILSTQMDEKIIAPELLQEMDGSSLSAKAHGLYLFLSNRAKPLEVDASGAEVRKRMSIPNVMARVLIDMDDELYNNRDVYLYGCRYLPPFDVFLKKPIEWGKNGAAFSKLSPCSWKSIYEGSSS